MSKLDQLKALGDAKRISRQNSRGGMEGRHAVRTNLQDGRLRLEVEAPIGTPIESVGNDPEPSRQAGVATGPRETKSKGGRPLAKDADKALMKTKPWLTEGMSRASWYRRKKEKVK